MISVADGRRETTRMDITKARLRSMTLNLTAIAACQQASRRRSGVARLCVKRDPESTAMICSQTLKNDTLTHPSLWADR